MVQVDQAQLASIVALLTGTQATSKEVREAAEARYNQALGTQPDMLIVALLTLAASHSDNGIRDTAIIFARQMMNENHESKYVWPKLMPDTQREVQAGVLNLLASEGNQSRVAKIVSIVDTLSNAVCQDDASKWPELKAAVLQLLQTPTSAMNGSLQRFKGLALLADTFSLIGRDILKVGQDAIIQGLRFAMEHADPQMRAEGVKAICSMVNELNAKEYRGIQSNFALPMVRMIEAMCKQFITQKADPAASKNNNDAIEACTQYLTSALEVDADFFKPVLADLSKLYFNVSQSVGIFPDDTRQLAFELICTMVEQKAKVCSKIPNFVVNAVRCAALFMLDLDDDMEGWTKRFSDEDDAGDDDNYEFGLMNMDRVSEAFGTDVVLPVAFALVAEYLAGDWKHKVVALMTLSQIAEYVEKDEHVDEIAKLLLRHVTIAEPHPRVRYAAIHALGQVSTDCAPYIQETWHEQVIAALSAAMDDPVPRVRTHACAAFINFGEECETEVILAHMDELMKKLVGRIVDGPGNVRQVRESAITAIAVIAGVTEKAIGAYYHSVVPVLKSIIQAQMAGGKLESRQILGKAFECLSLMGLAVGKDAFRADATEAMTSIVQLQQSGKLEGDGEEEDLLRCFIFEALQRIARTLGADFAGFLPHVMPWLLQSGKLQVGAVTSPESTVSGGSDESANLLSECANLKTDFIENLKTVWETIGSIVESMGAAFAPHISTTAQVLLPVMESGVESYDVTNVTVMVWSSLVKSAVEAGPAMKDVATSLTEAYVKYAFKRMNNDRDVDVLECQAHGLASVLDNTLDNLVTAPVCGELVSLVCGLIAASFERSKAAAEEENGHGGQSSPNERGHLDEDDLENIENEKELEDDVRLALGEVGTSLMKKHQAAFLANGVEAFAAIVKNNIASTNPPQSRSLALYIACDFLEHLKEKSLPSWPIYMDAMLQVISDPNPRLRQIASYGVNVASKIPAFSTAAKVAGQRLNSAISMPGAKSKPNAMATENAIAALGSLAHHQRAVLGDALTRDYFAKWIQHLPLVDDEAEGQATHALLLSLVNAQDPQVLGQNNANVAKIIGVFSHIYRRGNSDDATNAGIAKLLGQAGTDTLNGMTSAFTDKEKRKIARILSDFQKENHQ